jgi:hypothetical protein
MRYDITLEFALQDSQIEDFRRIAAAMAEQNLAEIQYAAKKMQSHELPLTASDIEQLSKFPRNQLGEILSHHRGHKVWQTILSCSKSFRLFEQSLADLNASINRYVEVCENGKATEIPDELHFEADLRIQKELFATLAACASLADISMQLSKMVTDIDYGRQLGYFLGSDGVLELIKVLRNCAQHRQPIQISGYSRNNFDGQRTHGYKINLEFLNRESAAMFEAGKVTKGQHDRLKQFINSIQTADIQIIFSIYSKRAIGFTSWLVNVLREKNPNSWLDCECCTLENIKFWDKTTLSVE